MDVVGSRDHLGGHNKDIRDHQDVVHDHHDVVGSRDHLGDYLIIKVYENHDELIELVLIDRR